MSLEDQIVNKVAQSSLVQLDLERLVPKGTRAVFDVRPFLWQEMVVKEKEFRQYVKEYEWSQYDGIFVAVEEVIEAIVPLWAYMLLASSLEPFATKVVLGTAGDLETELIYDAIDAMDVADYADKPVIIKGCSNKLIPKGAYIRVIEKLQPVAKSIMFGEPCSTVPLYKKKRRPSHIK